ncbi:MAG: FAD-dependent monooxygenase, partial [Halioglobus sp.]
MKIETTAVVICGAGPAGLTLAHLLGQQEVDVILVERLPETVAEPRAIAIDGESLRTLQQVGMLEGFESELLQGLTAVYERGDGGELFRVGNPELKPYGYSTVNSFDQPTLDRYLAKELEARKTVDVRFNTDLESFDQDESGVRVICRDSDGESFEIKADYLIGADGGRSTIRSLLKMEIKGESTPLPGLVLDTVDPIPEGQLDCQFYCDPPRPGMPRRKQ